MTGTQIYSDASIRHEAAGYAAVIVREGRTDELIRGTIPGVKFAATAEIVSLSIALNHLAPTPHVLVSTDLDWLPDIMGQFDKKFIRFGHTIRAQLIALHMACQRHERVDFRVVSRSDGRYRRCHREAYKQAAICALQIGTLTESGPVMQAARRKLRRTEEIARNRELNASKKREPHIIVVARDGTTKQVSSLRGGLEI